MNQALPWWPELAPLLAEHDSQSIEQEAKQLRAKANDASEHQLTAWAVIARRLVDELDLRAARQAVKTAGVRRQKLEHEIARLERLQQDQQHAAQHAYEDAQQHTGIGKAKRQAREAALAEMESFRQQARTTRKHQYQVQAQLDELRDPANLHPWVIDNHRVIALGVAAEWARDAPARAVRHLLGSPTLAHIASPLIADDGTLDLEHLPADAETSAEGEILLALVAWLRADHHEESPPVGTLSRLNRPDLQRALEAIAMAHRIAKLAPEEPDTAWLDAERAVKRRWRKVGRVQILLDDPPPKPPPGAND